MKNKIDMHLHFYTGEDLAAIGANLPYALPKPHPLRSYLDGLLDAGIRPTLINNVHISILPDSENVFRSFRELAALQAEDAARYGDIRLVGTLLADPDYATEERLAHPQVKGLRIVLHDTPAEKVSALDYQQRLRPLFQRLRPDQHVHVYAKHPATNLKVLQHIPAHIPVAIDHLGCCYAELGAEHADYQELLATAAKRGNVWFKGPGYRTDIQPENVVPFAVAIVRKVGADKLVLEATDAPHVGADNQGRAYAAHFTPETTYHFVQTLAEATARETGCDAARLLHGNAESLLSLSIKQESPA